MDPRNVIPDQSVIDTLVGPTHTADVVVTADADNSPFSVPVTLDISVHILVLSESALTFDAERDRAGTPINQLINLTKSTLSPTQIASLVAAIVYNDAVVNWLTAVLDTTTTPAILTVNADAASLFLEPVTLTATIHITSDALEATINVSLIINKFYNDVTPINPSFANDVTPISPSYASEPAAI
jgi:hypothetical protein